MLVYPDQVIMARNASGAWEVQVPGGGYLDTSASDSDGLQEAIDFALTEGFEMKVIGGRGATINLAATLNVPVMVDSYVEIGAVMLNWPTAIDGPGIEFDTIVHSTFIFRGNTAYRGDDSVVKVRGRTTDNTVTGAIDSKLEFFRLRAVAGNGPSGIHFDMSSGMMRSVVVEVVEIEGRTVEGMVMGDGIRVSHPHVDPHNYFVDNIITAHRIKGCGGAGIRVGDNTRHTLAGRIEGNQWRATIFPHGQQAAGVTTWEKYGRYDLSLSNFEQPFDTGIYLAETAEKNLFLVSRNAATTHKVLDNSIAQDSLIVSPAP